MSRIPIRSSWRAAALLALLAFAGLPHGHLRGHEELAAARAVAGCEPTALAALPRADAGEARHLACPVCLSLARVRDALTQNAGIEIAVLAGVRLPVPAHVAPRIEAPVSAHTAPRSPPLA